MCTQTSESMNNDTESRHWKKLSLLYGHNFTNMPLCPRWESHTSDFQWCQCITKLCPKIEMKKIWDIFFSFLSFKLQINFVHMRRRKVLIKKAQKCFHSTSHFYNTISLLSLLRTARAFHCLQATNCEYKDLMELLLGAPLIHRPSIRHTGLG